MKCLSIQEMKSDLQGESEKAGKELVVKLLTEFVTSCIFSSMFFLDWNEDSTTIVTSYTDLMVFRRSGSQKMDKCKWKREGRRKKNSGCGSGKRKRVKVN